MDLFTHDDSEEDLHRRLWAPADRFASNLHQQADQTILALAVFGINSNEFASAWLSHLQEENGNLNRLSVLFRLKELRRSLERTDAPE